jgi:hypothetical protein
LRDRAQTGPSMRSASASEEKRLITGQDLGLCALSLTNSDGLLKESCEYRRVRALLLQGDRVEGAAMPHGRRGANSFHGRPNGARRAHRWPISIPVLRTTPMA